MPDASSRTVAPPDLVEHISLLHELARAYVGQGKLVLASYGQDPETEKKLPAVNLHYEIGDVGGMVAGALRLSQEPHRNVYVSFCVYCRDLAPNAKGAEADVMAVLAFVADFDDGDAARYRNRLPVSPSFVIESSAGRFQPFLVLARPLSVAEAKPLAQRLKASVRCDHGTADVSHVWRVPGTLNCPNALKVRSGRSPEPQQVRVAEAWYGEVVSPETLDELLPALPKPKPPDQSPDHSPSDGADLPAGLVARMAGPAVVGHRSEDFHFVVSALTERGWDELRIVQEISRHPDGPGCSKYGVGPRLQKEVQRVMGKTAPKPASDRWDGVKKTGGQNHQRRTGSDSGAPQEPPGDAAAGESGEAAPPDSDDRAQDGAAAALPLNVVRLRDIKLDLRNSCVIKGVLGLNAVSVIIGEPASGKSAFALMLGMHIALGQPWYGHKVNPGLVVYLALEGTTGFLNRAIAFMRHHNITEDVPFAVVTSPVDLRSSDADANKVVETVKALEQEYGLPVRAVFVDTLFRALSGGDENGPQDMGALVRHANLIQDSLNTHVSIIHHVGKDATRGARGHSSLNGAVDTSIEVTRGEDGTIRTATIKKQKDLPSEGQTFSYAIKKVVLGLDEDGDEVTSCVAVEVDAPDAPDKPAAEPAAKAKVSLSPSCQIALDALCNAVIDIGKPLPAGQNIPRGVRGVREEQWREYCYKSQISDSDDQGARQKAFKRASDTLKAKRLVGIWDAWVWVPRLDQKSTGGDTGDGSGSGEPRPDKAGMSGYVRACPGGDKPGQDNGSTRDKSRSGEDNGHKVGEDCTLKEKIKRDNAEGELASVSTPGQNRTKPDMSGNVRGTEPDRGPDSQGVSPPRRGGGTPMSGLSGCWPANLTADVSGEGVPTEPVRGEIADSDEADNVTEWEEFEA